MLFQMARATLSSSTRNSLLVHNKKDLWILRHGQATHNPRAEAAKAAGCSFEEFFDLMRQDDSLDSPLTDLGHEQARRVYQQQQQQQHGMLSTHTQLVVSSPLSRALQTADGALPPPSLSTTTTTTKRVCYEGFREINGVLRNAQRRSVTELRQRFGPHWDFDQLPTEHDEMWQEDVLESFDECKERGFQGLKWLFHEREETRILLVAHGGILRYTLSEHPQVVLRDGRRHRHRSLERESSTNEKQSEQEQQQQRPVEARFHNCELRRYHVTWDDETESIVLTEVDFDHPLAVEQDDQKDAGNDEDDDKVAAGAAGLL